MRKFQKLLCLTLAVVMLFALTATTSAAGETGIIDIVNTVEGVSIEGVRFNAYRVLSLTYNADTGAYFYSPSEEFADFFAVHPEYAVESLAAADAVTLEAFSRAIMEYIDMYGPAFEDYTTGRDSQTATIVGVPLGYYVVTGVGLREDNGDYIVSMCMIDTTDLGAVVYLKLDVPFVEKKVEDWVMWYEIEGDELGDEIGLFPGWADSTDTSIGYTARFLLSSQVPAMQGYDNYAITFHDTLSQGLTFIEDSVLVKIGDVPLGAGDYTLSPGCANADCDCSFSLKIQLKQNDTARYNVGAPITVEYSARLNEFAMTYPGANPNTVYLEYNNSPYDTNSTGQTPPDTVNVYTYSLGIVKFRHRTELEIENNVQPSWPGEDYMLLPGAAFELYNRPEDEVSRQPLRFKRMGYTYDYMHTTVYGENTVLQAYEGYLHINGLGTGTYYLKEVITPDGYNPLEKEIKIVITSESDGALVTKVTVTQDGEEVDAIGVLNETGPRLPSTGGIGTTMFTVGGITLMGGAIAVIGIRKKRGSKDTDAE